MPGQDNQDSRQKHTAQVVTAHTVKNRTLKKQSTSKKLNRENSAKKPLTVDRCVALDLPWTEHPAPSVPGGPGFPSDQNTGFSLRKKLGSPIVFLGV